MKSDLNEKLLLFFFSKIKGLGSGTLWSLIKSYGSCQALYQAARENDPLLGSRLTQLIQQPQRNKNFQTTVKK